MSGCPTAASNFDNTSCKDLREVRLTRSTLMPALLIRAAFILIAFDPFVRLFAFENNSDGQYRKLVRAAPAATLAVAAFAHSMSDCRERQNARTNRSVCSLPRTIC